MHASKFVGGNMLRRGESSWLCMKFELAFLVDHGILIRVLPPSFLALSVNEYFLLLLPNPYANSCFLLCFFASSDCAVIRFLYFDQGSSAFIFCALILNVIGLLFL